MSAGKRFKFNGTVVALITAFTNVSPTDSISAVTKANPAVVTETAHGRASGDVIKIESAVGMTELNGGVYVIELVDANSYKLIGVDSSAYGTYTSGGKVHIGVFSNFCELKGYNRQGGSSPEIDATTVCSTAAEYEVGLPDFGTTQLDFNFAPSTAVQQAIADFYSGDNAGDTMAVKIVLPNSGGNMVQLATIQQTSESAAVNGLWTATMALRNTGARYDF